MSLAGCGGDDSPSAPTTPPPTPDVSVAPGTVLGVYSGETGQPVVGARVVVAARGYDTDGAGQITLADRAPYDSLVDVTAPGFLDRQTLLRRNGERRFVLWPRSTPWGLDETYTAELVYTYGTSEPPPVGSSPLERLRRGTTQAVVVLSEELRAIEQAHAAHLDAVAYLNEALGDRVSYVLAPQRPTTGVVFEALLNPADPSCANRTLAFARVSYQSQEIVSGTIVYCRRERVTTSLAVHELGHTLGLNHSPRDQDVMFRFITGRTKFSRAESLSLAMLFERPGGNRFPDSDRGVAGAGSGSRTIVCN